MEGLRKIRIIAKATRTLVNLNSFERSESVASKRMQATSRSPSCGALSHNRLTTPSANLNLSPSRARSAGGGPASLACSFDDSASANCDPFTDPPSTNPTQHHCHVPFGNLTPNWRPQRINRLLYCRTRSSQKIRIILPIRSQQRTPVFTSNIIIVAERTTSPIGAF